MSDKLVVDIDSKDAEVAMRNLDRLTAAAEQMGKAFENTKGATSALRELRLMLTGIKGQQSSLDQLTDSIKNINSSSESLKRSIVGSIKSLGTIIKSEMEQVRAVMFTSGVSTGKALAEGIDDSTSIATGAVKRQGRTLAAAAKAEATRVYEAMVAGQANAKIKDVGALFQLSEAGATLSPYHKEILENWKKSSAETFKALKAQRDAEAAADKQATTEKLANIAAIGKAWKLNKASQEADTKAELAAARSQAAADKEITADRLANIAAIGNIWKRMSPQIKIEAKAAADAEIASTNEAIAAHRRHIDILNAKIVASNKAATAARTANIGNTGTKLGGAEVVGTYVPYDALRVAADKPEILKVKPQEVDALSKAFRKLTIDGNDLHSMARGLASGFNLLWLTWGNLVPLFAGAAISNGFMQTIKLGAQVGHTFQTIASLGEVSAEGVAKLRTQLYEIGKSGPYGPEQTAEAMKTLALAGLRLNEILAVTPTVLNFALAGTTTITQAADVLVSVTSAFGTGAAGFEEAADIITRSAADSKASVESFGEAMKTASVVGELYGAAQRDVALMIQYLSQVGIQGTSAGTAVRNAMADISGRSGQAQRILKSLGAEFKQSTGEVIPFIDQMRELNRITKDYDAISQKNIINAIYGERGSKVAAVGLQAFNAAARDASKYSNKLEEDLARLEDAAGDSAIASAQMAQSTQKAFEAVAATAKTVLVEAFDSIEPQMYLVADALRKAFASDEAREGLRTMVTAVAELAMVVAKNLPTIIEYGLAWAAFKAAMFGAKAIVAASTTLLGLYTNAKIKDIEATVAQTAAETALTRAIGAKKAAVVSSGAAALSMGTKLLGVLPVVGNAVLLGSLAWDLYKSSVSEAGKTVDNYVDTKADNIIAALENETRHIREVNELRAQGLTLMEAEARVKFSNSKSEMLSGSEAKIEAAEEEIRRLRAANASYNNPTDASYGLLARKENTAKILELEAEIAEARNQQGTAALRMTLAENERREAAQEALRLTRAEQEAALKPSVAGTKTWSLDEFQAGGKGFGGPKEFYEAQKTAFDKSIQEIEKRGKVEIEKLQSIAADKKAILDSEQQAGLISTEEYNSQLLVLLKSSEDAQIAEIKKTSQAFFAEYTDRHRTISALIAKAEATPAKSKGASAAKASNLAQLRAELSTLEELDITSTEQWSASIGKLTSRYDKDLRVAINKNLGSLKKLREEDDKFWKDQTDELAKAKALEAVNQQYANINESVFSLDEANKAYALAFADSFAKVEAYSAKLNTELEAAKHAADEFWHAAVADGEFSDADSSGYISYLKKVQELERLIIEARAKGETLAGDTGNLAFDRKRREQNAKLANDLSDAVMTGLVDGGEAGKKKLRDMLVAEIRRPIKMVVDLTMNAAVNGIMGSLGLGGKAAAGVAGQAGSSFLSSAGGSMLGNMVGGFGAFTGAMGSGFSMAMSGGMGLALEGGMAMLGSATGVSSALAGIGQIAGALGPIALGIGAIAAIAKSLDDSGTYHTGGAAQYSAAGGLLSGQSGAAYNIGFGRVEAGADSIKAVGGIAQALGTALDGVAVAFGKRAGYEIATAFADDTSEDGAWGALRISREGQDLLNWEKTRQSRWAPREFGDGEGGYKEYLAAVAKDTRQVLLDMDLPGWADTVLNAIGDSPSIESLSAALTQIGQAQTVFKSFGQYMTTFATWADSSVTKLAAASGGIDVLAGNMGVFVDQFYRDSEKLAVNTANVKDALAQLGFEMPATRDEFKALVQSQIALGDGGAKTTAGLLALSGAVSAVLPPFEDAAAGVEEAIDTVSDTMRRLQSDTADLEIELLRAQGNITGADAAQRAIDTAGFTEAEVALYDYNTALRTQISAIKEAAENMRTLRSSLIGLESSFAGGGFSRQYRAEDAAGTVSGLLADVGIQKDAGMLAQKMLSATGDEVMTYFREIWDVLDTDEARQKLVDVTGVMMDLATGAGSAAEAYQKQQTALQDMAQEASRLLSARNGAGSLMDRLSGAMGNKGTFGAQRESELWGALGSTRDAEKQVELASQLTDLVLSRQQLEVQNAEQMLSFGRSLRSYVDGLKIGSLSPLTNAEKLAEASSQYNEVLGKAQSGDADAQAKLQGIASTYLELARTYFAGNEQFSAIFDAVTSSLDALGVSSMSEAQQQLSLGTQSLGELQRLYSIAETAYGSLNAQYETAVGELTAAQDALVLQSNSLDQLKEIAGLLSGLPAEIAVRLPAINTESATYLPPAMLAQQGAQGDNEALIAELQALRREVAELRAENRQDAQMVAGATVASASASASQIADATAKAAYTTTVKQGAVLV